MVEGWLLTRGSSLCAQMLVRRQLLQLDPLPVAVVLCFGEDRGGRAARRGGAAGVRGARPPRCLPSPSPFYFALFPVVHLALKL